jgi:ADP-heptose:LPS heptosyltransferase
LLPVRRILLHQARTARAAGRFADAAASYEAALRLRPDDTGLLIQCGHMRKEAGEFDAAGAHYAAALARTPDDPELALQLGHFAKLTGRLDRAEAQYARALALKPGWDMAERELRDLTRSGWLAGSIAAGSIGASLSDPVETWEKALTEVRNVGRLVPGLAPRSTDERIVRYAETIEIRRLGRREPGFWGVRPTLRGVEAIRGFAISAEPIVEAQVILDGVRLHCGPVKGGYALANAAPDESLRKYVFNIWLDFTGCDHGLHEIEVRLLRVDGETRSFRDRVVVAEALSEQAFPDSDGIVTVDPASNLSIDAQVRARPSMVRPAARAVFPDGLRNILVLRTDQLGDVIASIPAMRRLREIAPAARLVGLLTAANADIARTLELFDEIIVVDFPDDPVERRRIMPLEAQETLRQRLAPYRFDLALDLAQSDVSRELLQLSGARFLYGVGGGDWPWLSAEFQFNSHDARSGLDVVPHSTKVLAMIEALGATLDTKAPMVRRADLTQEMLATYGIADGDRFAVLHMGARVTFSRWPHFPLLARMLLDESDLKVVLMTEDPAIRPTLPPALLASERFIFLDRRLPFDDFDAFISFATVVVGNDSGPKHLAALRGTNVVTLFTARINWQEWGQEKVGTIISRKVPCQGCLIFHDAEECGQDFTCIADIRPREVLDAALRYV